MHKGLTILGVFYALLGVILLLATCVEVPKAYAGYCPPGTHEVIGPIRCTPQGCRGIIWCVTD